jgi:hypothetical protein
MRFRRTLAAMIVALRLGATHAQTPAESYESAKSIYAAHAPQFFHDGSHLAIEALNAMNAAAADALVLELSHNPNAPAAQLEAVLCQLDSKACAQQETSQEVVQLGPGLFLASQAREEVGTVFIVGLHNQRPALLWSIASALPQRNDPRHLVTGWYPERANESCRQKQLERLWGSCGPLFASLGKLPSDAAGHPRFYIDAEYAEGAGTTAARQISLWRWLGDKPELLWIHTYYIMIDQKLGTSVSNDILSIAEKHEFRSFQSYDSSEGRQVIHRVRVAPTGIQDLGSRPLYPELDLVDALFWRLNHDRATADIVTPQVVRVVVRP